MTLLGPVEWLSFLGECHVFGLLLRLPYADYHWDCLIYFYLDLFTKAMTLIIVLLHCDLSYLLYNTDHYKYDYPW